MSHHEIREEGVTIQIGSKKLPRDTSLWKTSKFYSQEYSNSGRKIVCMRVVRILNILYIQKLEVCGFNSCKILLYGVGEGKLWKERRQNPVNAGLCGMSHGVWPLSWKIWELIEEFQKNDPIIIIIAIISIKFNLYWGFILCHAHF